jgi:hypothetical protein
MNCPVAKPGNGSNLQNDSNRAKAHSLANGHGGKPTTAGSYWRGNPKLNWQSEKWTVFRTW